MEAKKATFPCKDFGSFDLVVVGGGCTGVFAAVRAARLGLRVAIVEKGNCFGGVATSGLVNIWHSLFDTTQNEQIIGGLTAEVVQILTEQGYAQCDKQQNSAILFDPNAMKWTLDALAVKSGITVFFHTVYGALTLCDGQISSLLVANKDGLGEIRASFFIDATGDGDLCRDAGIPSYTAPAVQPPTPCCLVAGHMKTTTAELIQKHGAEFGITDDWGWSSAIPGMDDVKLRADFHIFGKMCNKADDLTAAEIEGREKLHTLSLLFKKYADPSPAIVSLGTQIGVRETVHFTTRFRATEQDLLLGRSYDDTVMKGSYRIDIHHQNDSGITFKYLDGRTVTMHGKASRTTTGNWREELGITAPPATYYQAPFDILVQERIGNLIPVGRMLHADEGAFGALRVMVNLNQLGEAAGVGAYLSLAQSKRIFELSGKDVQKVLREGGSLV